MGPFKMTPISGVGLELWSMSDNIYFDNFLITDNMGLADAFARETFDLKQAADASANGNIFRRILDYSNKNPWLYAVYVVLVGLPLVLIITFCCSGSADNPDGKSSLNDPKKTDDPQDDDEEERKRTMVLVMRKMVGRRRRRRRDKSLNMRRRKNRMSPQPQGARPGKGGQGRIK